MKVQKFAGTFVWCLVFVARGIDSWKGAFRKQPLLDLSADKEPRKSS